MRILIADDNEPVRRGVAGILSSGTNLQVCGEAEDGEAAILMARKLLPDLILLDMRMPGIGGLEAATLIRQEWPRVKIVMLSQHDPVLLLPRALEAGADACVDKSRLDLDLLPTIMNIHTIAKRRPIAS